LDEKVYGIKKRKYAAHVTKILRETREKIFGLFSYGRQYVVKKNGYRVSFMIEEKC
jgi:hypothetical protein